MPSETKAEGFWVKLRRRKVVQWGCTYAAAAWALLQGVDFLVDAFGWPDATRPLATLVLLLGLPIAVVIAWYHGDRGEQRVNAAELSIIFLLLLLGGGFLRFYQHRVDPVPVEILAEQAAIEPENTTLAASRTSIAVLPFVNISDDEGNEYFSDGLSEELLNLLARIPELQVTSRSSAFSYKGKDFKIADVARELKVAHVLEGSVRKAGNQVRITAQLIDTRTDTHLWSETYERTLDNIFAIQDEIAAKVVAQLKINLLGDVPRALVANPEAYTLFLKGRHMSRQKSAATLAQAQALLQQALAIDPAYAAAWDELGSVYTIQANLGLRPIDEGMTLARETFVQALAIDPGYALAHANLAYITLAYDNDLAAAARHLERALQLDPANTDIIRKASDLSASLGRLDEAIALAQFVVARDPVSPASHANLGLHYLSAGRWDQAIASLNTTLTLSPGYSIARYGTGIALMRKGDLTGALEAMQMEHSIWSMIGLPMVYYTMGQPGESDAALAALIQQYEKVAAYSIASVLAYRGESDRAFAWLDKAAQYKDPGLAEIPGERLFFNIHDDPRWLPFLERIGKSPGQLDAIEFKVSLP